MSKEWEKYFEQGSRAFEQGQISEAETYLKAAVGEAERGEDKMILAASLERLGELYFEVQRF